MTPLGKFLNICMLIMFLVYVSVLFAWIITPEAEMDGHVAGFCILAIGAVIIFNSIDPKEILPRRANNVDSDN